MPTEVTTALIAAVVSIIVSSLSAWSARKSAISEERRHALDHRRRLTERLLSLRLAAYPALFSLTYQLTSDSLLRGVSPTRADLLDLRQKLKEWERDSGAFVMTRDSLSRFRELVNALNLKPGQEPTREQLEKIWQAKNRVRGALKADLALLYEEDSRPDNADSKTAKN